MEQSSSFIRRLLSTTVVVSSLGYFVDIYDLIVFSIVRVPSLQAIGVPEGELMAKGSLLLNMQMAGMLLGGILWGVLGDRRGRVSVLYGSILLYSLANIANALILSFDAWVCLRFIAGIGLAGELGAAVTLVLETLADRDRGYGVALVASVGILGAIFAAFISEVFSWQAAYLVGGGMGLLLLAFRLKMQDSPMFAMVQADHGVRKGQFFMLFSDRQRFYRYLGCILIGAPNWFIIGILVAFAPEITSNLEASGPVIVGRGIAWTYLGLSLGDLASGFLSQWLQSRRRVVFLFLSFTIPLMALYLTQDHWTPEANYLLFFALGFSNGYWAVLNTLAAEQFGTNLRATAATTVPNFIRAMVIPLTLSVQTLAVYVGLVQAVMVVAVVCMSLAYLGLMVLEETFHKKLNYVEMD